MSSSSRVTSWFRHLWIYSYPALRQSEVEGGMDKKRLLSCQRLRLFPVAKEEDRAKLQEEN